VTLLAGDTNKFQVRSNRSDLDVAALARKPVLRSANDLISHD
jgi:hypothetical protein